MRWKSILAFRERAGTAAPREDAVFIVLTGRPWRFRRDDGVDVDGYALIRLEYNGAGAYLELHGLGFIRPVAMAKQITQPFLKIQIRHTFSLLTIMSIMNYSKAEAFLNRTGVFSLYFKDDGSVDL